MTQLTKHFSLAEFEASSTAVRLGIDNHVPAEFVHNVFLTAMMLERIRGFLSAQLGRDVPIRITSGYRCLELNRALGSKDTSDHVTGLAVDWEAPSFGTPSFIARVLREHMDELGIGQLIDEYPPDGWVHTGVPTPANPVNVALVIDHDGTRPMEVV